MADNSTAVDIATLKNEILHLRESLETSESACKIRDEEAMRRIKVLEEYKAKTEKYGFFLMGMVAVGTLIASGLEKAVHKIMGLIQ